MLRLHVDLNAPMHAYTHTNTYHAHKTQFSTIKIIHTGPPIKLTHTRPPIKLTNTPPNVLKNLNVNNNYYMSTINFQNGTYLSTREQLMNPTRTCKLE